jgi:hypothetical protein
LDRIIREYRSTCYCISLFQILANKTCTRPFALFASTIKYQLDPQFVHINIDVNGKNSSFSVPDVMDVQLENFKNPVTGEDQDTKIQLSKGFRWKISEAAKTKVMKILTLFEF